MGSPAIFKLLKAVEHVYYKLKKKLVACKIDTMEEVRTVGV